MTSHCTRRDTTPELVKDSSESSRIRDNPRVDTPPSEAVNTQDDEKAALANVVSAIAGLVQSHRTSLRTVDLFPIGWRRLLNVLGLIKYRDDSVQAINLRREWRQSPERKEAVSQFRWVWIPLALGLAGGLYLILAIPKDRFPIGTTPYERWVSQTYLIPLLLLVAALSIGAFLHRAIMEPAMDNLDDRLAIERLKAVDSLAASSEDPLDLAVLWSATDDRIRAYHTLATNQARSSFRIAQTVMIGVCGGDHAWDGCGIRAQRNGRHRRQRCRRVSGRSQRIRGCHVHEEPIRSQFPTPRVLPATGGVGPAARCRAPPQDPRRRPGAEGPGGRDDGHSDGPSTHRTS